MVYRVQNKALCKHLQHAEGFHEFIFLAASRQSIDEWFAHLERLYPSAPLGGTVRLLLNIERSGMLPLTYTAQQARQFINHNRVNLRLKLAYLHTASFPLTLVQRFWRSMQLDGDFEAAYFLVEERPAALDWLHKS